MNEQCYILKPSFWVCSLLNSVSFGVIPNKNNITNVSTTNKFNLIYSVYLYTANSSFNSI